MTIAVSEKIKQDIEKKFGLYGYSSFKEFVEDALKRRILDLQKTDFLQRVGKIKKEFLKKGLTEQDILSDFDKFYHRK